MQTTAVPCVSKNVPPLQLAPMEDVEPQDPQSTDPTTSQLTTCLKRAHSPTSQHHTQTSSTQESTISPPQCSPRHKKANIAPAPLPAPHSADLHLSDFQSDRKKDWSVPQITPPEDTLLITDSNGCSGMFPPPSPNWRVAAYRGRGADRT